MKWLRHLHDPWPLNQPIRKPSPDQAFPIGGGLIRVARWIWVTSEKHGRTKSPPKSKTLNVKTRNGYTLIYYFICHHEGRCLVAPAVMWFVYYNHQKFVFICITFTSCFDIIGQRFQNSDLDEAPSNQSTNRGRCVQSPGRTASQPLLKPLRLSPFAAEEFMVKHGSL